MSGVPPFQLPPQILEYVRNLQAVDMFQAGLITLILYEYLLTLNDEIEHVWKKPWNLMSVLYLLNRYFVPLEFAVVIAAFQMDWPEDVCHRFVRYEGAACAALMAICQIIMILRVHALYGSSRLVLGGLGVIWAAQLAVQVVALLASGALEVPFPAGCILIGRASIYTALWVGPLVLDACIFALTLWRMKRYMERSARMPTFQLILRDGLLYFALIFGANLLNMVVYLTADDSMKSFFAPFSEIVTSIMVSRIVLNLRGLNSHQADLDTDRSHFGASNAAPLAFRQSETNFSSMGSQGKGEIGSVGRQKTRFTSDEDADAVSMDDFSLA